MTTPPVRHLVLLAAFALAAVGASALGGTAVPESPVPRYEAVVPAPVSHNKFGISAANANAAPLVERAKLLKAVTGWRREAKRADRLARTLREGPDFEVSLQLAGIAYGQDWRHLLRCALSEGARGAERFDRHNRRPNSAGSGATSSFQFMRGTFLSTPFAAMDWTRQDVQAFAAAWMWKSGRRGEWAGAGC